ncbi:hypothetical protein HN51_012657 [Arachis hypogaea]
MLSWLYRLRSLTPSHAYWYRNWRSKSEEDERAKKIKEDCSLSCRRRFPARRHLAARRRAQIEEESLQASSFPPPLGQAVIYFSAVLLAAVLIVCDPQSRRVLYPRGAAQNWEWSNLQH